MSQLPTSSLARLSSRIQPRRRRSSSGPGGPAAPLATAAAQIATTDRVLDRIRQRDALGLNQPGAGGFVNPSGPPLLRRQQGENRLRDEGIDPIMLRRSLNQRRTSNEALLRRRRALGRRAAVLERSGNRAGAEEIRAEIALLEGTRMDDAREIARDSALFRGGSSRTPDERQLERIRSGQALTRRQQALALDTANTAVDVGLAGNVTAREDAQVLARDAQIRNIVGEQTQDTVVNTRVTEAQRNHELAQLDLLRAMDNIENATDDFEAERALREAETAMKRAEAELVQAQAQTQIEAETTTRPDRVGTAEANAAADRAAAEGRANRVSPNQVGIDPDKTVEIDGEEVNLFERATIDIPNRLAELRDETASNATIEELKAFERTIQSVIQGAPDGGRTYARHVLESILEFFPGEGTIEGRQRDTLGQNIGQFTVTRLPRARSQNTIRARTAYNRIIRRLESAMRQE